MSLIRKHGAVLQAWACLDLVHIYCQYMTTHSLLDYLISQCARSRTHAIGVCVNWLNGG